MYKTIVNGSLLLIGVAFAQMTAQAQKTETSGGMEYTLHPGGSGGPATEYINIIRDGKSYRMVRSRDKIREFYVDDRRIPDDSIAHYQSVIKKIDEEVRIDRERAGQDKVEAEKDRSQALIDQQQAELDRQQTMIDRQQAEKDKQIAEQDMQQAKMEQQQAFRDQQQAKMDQDQANKDHRQAHSDQE